MTSQRDAGRGDHAPSARSVARLAEGLEDELADLRVDVDDELRLAKVLRDAGEVDAARLLLERPVSRTRAAHSRLRELIAAAAVERAAEEVLATADVGAPPQRDRRRDVRLRRVPAVLATVLAVLVAMVLSSPAQGPSPSMVASANGSSAQAIATILRIETGRLAAGTAAGAVDAPGSVGVEDPGAPASGPFGPWHGPDAAPSGGHPVAASAAIVGWFDASLLTLRRSAETASGDRPQEGATTPPTSEAVDDLVDEVDGSLDDPDDGSTSVGDEIRDVVSDVAPSDDDGDDVVSTDDGR